MKYTKRLLFSQGWIVQSLIGQLDGGTGQPRDTRLALCLFWLIGSAFVMNIDDGISLHGQCPVHQDNKGLLPGNPDKPGSRRPLNGDRAQFLGHSPAGDLRRCDDGDTPLQGFQFPVYRFDACSSGIPVAHFLHCKGAEKQKGDRNEDHRFDVPEDRFHIHGWILLGPGCPRPDQAFFPFGDFILIMSPRDPNPLAPFWR
jgi:hypothetical protein